MQVICDQNRVALAHKDDPTIIGWLQQDEPDNAQSLPGGKGYGPPICRPASLRDYESVAQGGCHAASVPRLRPGRGLGWMVRPRRSHQSPRGLPEYFKGCDIASFDIYPIADSHPQYAGQLGFVGQGVARLVKWTDGRKPVWNAIECTRINTGVKPTPKQVKAEVWIALVNGSRGIVYFCHEFKPKSTDRALLDDAEMLAAVTAINSRIRRLAPALNSPTVMDAVKVESSNQGVPVATMVKKQGGATYVFAVSMKAGETNASFTLGGLAAGAEVQVLGENRNVESADGKFQDHFGEWDVHLYRIR